MSLNIKHPEAHRLAKELATATGTSMTEVVTEALRERWEREQHAATRRTPKERARLIERALAIGRDCAARLAQAELPENPDELLFDERGLPHDAGR
ncbi:MAG: type II toxin-antitoxin system VapB family antitoxin [Trueperaceae bacterium]